MSAADTEAAVRLEAIAKEIRGASQASPGLLARLKAMVGKKPELKPSVDVLGQVLESRLPPEVQIALLGFPGISPTTAPAQIKRARGLMDLAAAAHVPSKNQRVAEYVSNDTHIEVARALLLQEWAESGGDELTTSHPQSNRIPTADEVYKRRQR